MSLLLRERDGELQFAIKVVPGAARDRIVGLYGAALKVTVAAPPEQGKANQAVCRLLALALALPLRAVRVVSGQASPRKTIAVQGLTAAEFGARLGF